MPKNWMMAFVAVAALAAPAAAVPIGAPAPDFTLKDIASKPVKLSSYRGRTVVLEWNNLLCPFVGEHYGTGNMQRTQAAAEKAGVVWLTINSGAHATVGAVKAKLAAWKAHPTDYLLDPTGKIGSTYGAKVTPHMYIVDRTGRLVYQGGIDDKPTLDPEDIPENLKTADNYVLRALGEMRAGKPISKADTRPYGCPIKYRS